MEARRDEARRKEEAAQEVIRAGEQHAVRERELNEAEAAYRAAQQVRESAQLVVDLANTTGSWRRAVENAESKALEAVARVRAAVSVFERLGAAEKGFAELQAQGTELEDRLAANTAARQECEVRGPLPQPLPAAAALSSGLVAGAAGAVLGMVLKVDSRLLALLAVLAALAAAGVAAILVRRHKWRQATQVWQRQLDSLASARQELLERRGQLTIRRGLTDLEAKGAQAERERSTGDAEESQREFRKALEELGKATPELTPSRLKLSSLESYERSNQIVAQLEKARRLVAALENEIHSRRAILQETRRALTGAQTASQAGASAHLTLLEERLKAAGQEATEGLVPDLEEAKQKLEIAAKSARHLKSIWDQKIGEASAEGSRLTELEATLGRPAEGLLREAQMERAMAERELADPDKKPPPELEGAESKFQEAEKEVNDLQQEFDEATRQAEEAIKRGDEARTARDQAKAKLDESLWSCPDTDLASAETALGKAREELREFEPDLDWSTEQSTRTEQRLKRSEDELRGINDYLQQAQGQLKLVGGDVVREQRERAAEALAVLQEKAEDVELEYKAAKRLLDVLKEAEAKHADHLGQRLAKPVSAMFQEFTSSRYGQIAFDQNLLPGKIAAAGDKRDLGSLSVGTRDQLATLIRLALAAQLKTVLLLDDQLTQSDTGRMDWFRDRLRASVREHGHQIIVVTCRPRDYLQPEEMPGAGSGDGAWNSDDGMLAVVALEGIVSRH